MIAKGLHFPNVTLVGIVNADMGLFMPDFRAAERSFQLLTQVAGRAGRGEVKGEVLVQTCSPFNPPIMFAAEHDYEGFYQEEIAVREELKYPPFGHMMIVHFRGEDPAEIMAEATALMEKIQPCLDHRFRACARTDRTCQGQIPLHGGFPLWETGSAPPRPAPRDLFRPPPERRNLCGCGCHFHAVDSCFNLFRQNIWRRIQFPAKNS